MIKELSQKITDIYETIAKNSEIKEIKHWIFHNTIEYNDKIRDLMQDLNNQERKIRTEVNTISNTIEDYRMIIMKCHHFIELEKGKNEKLRHDYDKFYKKKAGKTYEMQK